MEAKKKLFLANKLFYWPGLANDDIYPILLILLQTTSKQKQNPCVTSAPSESFGPHMAQIGLDLFDFAGKKHILCVDKWSGFPLFKCLQTQSTKAVTDILESWFNVLGWPSSIHSDGGPQFCEPFRDWCQKKHQA